jgi:probable F420-dependent oxidoreductase
MKFGLRYCNTGRFVDPARAVELVQAAEAAGFESAWTVEHTVIPHGYQSQYPYSPSGKLPGGDGDFDLPDPLIWMAYVSAATTRIKLATGVIILPQHNPVITAKQVATLDHMSGGRVLLGVGVGWLKEEFEAVGSPFHERGARTDEYISVMRELWQADRPSFHGKFFSFQRRLHAAQAGQTVGPNCHRRPLRFGGQTGRAAWRWLLSRTRRPSRADQTRSRHGIRSWPRPSRDRNYNESAKGSGRDSEDGGSRDRPCANTSDVYTGVRQRRPWSGRYATLESRDRAICVVGRGRSCPSEPNRG